MSKQVGAHQKLYSSAFWKRRRLLQLREHPLCAFCLKRGEVVRARVCDHVVPHHGDERLFVEGELQSLCWPCHEQRKNSVERLGYDKSIGADGWPCDPLHPAYTRTVIREGR